MYSRNLLVFILPFVLFSSYPVMAAGYVQVPGLIDLRTTYSDGELDLESLVRLAKARGFGVLFINDHDRLAMEYGLFPLKNILKKRVELNSINKGGPEKYLNGIKRIQGKHPDMIIIPGSETAPFYYWTGSYFKNTLTAHNHERRILIIGLENPDDYKELPILHNGFSTRYVRTSLPIIIFFLIPLALGILLLKWKGFSRISGFIICGVSLLFIINTDPFRSSPFDQYHGDHGIAPYEKVIDYVDKRGGLTFWNYPETRSGRRKLGPIFVDTPPYPEVLEQSRGYTGFAALYGDTITITEPGNEWDRVLTEYCRGERDRPVWGISTADFHKDAGSGEKLGNFPTIFLVRERTKREILFAMRQGRMYACRGKYPQHMVLDDFSVCSGGCKTRAVSGDEMILTENAKVHVFLLLKKPTKNRVKVRLIRSGEVLEVFEGSLPMEIDYEDRFFKPGKKIYYRIDARGCGALVSNPIFVTFR
ncbi:MAG: hypothetical protein JRJ86_20510 [Deltaproteobacteria bacterium]|nr:hypothetical protein [Deltaproteobacteria bacterium]MBW2119429.1 hypothetical protein [Deltaproteobacteria bacterium]